MTEMRHPPTTTGPAGAQGGGGPSSGDSPAVSRKLRRAGGVDCAHAQVFRPTATGVLPKLAAGGASVSPAALSAERRERVLTLAARGMKYPDIGRAVGLSADTVSGILYRARVNGDKRARRRKPYCAGGRPRKAPEDKEPPIRLDSGITNPDRALASAVITQALVDARVVRGLNGGHGTATDYERDEAIRFLTIDRGGWREAREIWCDAADIDADVLCARARKALGMRG